MKAIVTPKYNKNIIRAMIGLELTDVKTPKPSDDEVVIKIHAAPINPSDIAFIQGVYSIVKPLPAIPGFEASGKVIAAGNNNKHLIGRNVSCFVQRDDSGTWAENVVANISDIILLNSDMDMNQAACFTVNPFTAYGLFEIALIHESTAIVQNASGGQVASFIRMMAAENNIKVIDIVRKEESAKKLIEAGANYVLIETDEDFDDKLKALVADLNATVAFDALGGPLAGMMFNAMPNDSELVVYGGLSNKPISDVDVMEVIFNNKIITGFNLMDWKADLLNEEFNDISEHLQQKFIDGKYHTKIKDKVQLSDVVKGLRSYISNMSSGKILILP